MEATSHHNHMQPRDGHGLDPIFTSPDDSSPAGRFIFVAIHGLRGDRRQSWTDNEGFCWLDSISNKFPDAHVLTFGYNDTIEAAADILLGDLKDYVVNAGLKAPYNIVFIAHSSGGTVAKQLFLVSSPIRTSRKEVQSIHAAIKGFVFFDTRHRGSFESSKAMSMIKWFRVADKMLPNGYLVTIDDFMGQYQRINKDFEHEGGEKLPIACFYETVPSPSVGILVSKQDATLDLAWVENKPGDGKLSEIGKLSNEHSVAAVRVWSAIRHIRMQVLGEAETIAPALQAQISPAPRPHIAPEIISSEDLYSGDSSIIQPGLRVLALDGGGFRGLFAIIVLQHIMEEVRKLDLPENSESPNPCDYFDLIGGTSTGGLLAIMLGRLHMDLVSCKLAYKSLSSGIFAQPLLSYIPGKRWVDAIRGAPERITLKEREQILTAQNIPSEAKLKSSFGKTKTLVCAIVDDSGGACERLRTYDSPDAGSGASCSIWEACRATSAASLYFPSITINGRTYWDGGMNSNNPILQVMEEARSNSEKAGVSRPCPESDPSSHLFGVVLYALNRMTETEGKHKDFMNRFPDKSEQYFRVNEETELYKIDLADWKKLDKVEKPANEYVSSVVGQRMITTCAKALSRNASGG